MVKNKKLKVWDKKLKKQEIGGNCGESTSLAAWQKLGVVETESEHKSLYKVT